MRQWKDLGTLITKFSKGNFYVRSCLQSLKAHMRRFIWCAHVKWSQPNVESFWFFFRLFEDDPGLQNMFAEFREVKLEELVQTRELHGHTERVMRAVENCVNAMDDPDSLRAYLTELGRRHVYRSVKPTVSNVSLAFNAFSPRSDQDIISPHNFNAISRSQLTRISKNIIKRLSPKTQNKLYKKCQADIKENCRWDIGSGKVDNLERLRY